MAFITIIATFYNSERFIPKLMKSVFAQTFTDWEMVCVCDCSPGNDAVLLTKIVEKAHAGDKVRIINNPQNMGISRSKEIGIKAARGKYLTFIDGDDWLDHDALRRMAEPA
ncbi:MAG: glycosyltransferase family 2 protein, partial [Bacteroidales bacterium]|nr:glycosyltransferase family 2 protein [Bacteroidales bacterium]